MMLRILALTLLALAVLVTATAAQTATTAQPAPSTSTSNQGAFDKLSPGNQKIARALYEAQQTQAQPSGSTTTTTEPLSLDDIAAMKQSGKGWGVIFKDMKAQGKLPPDAKNLGQVVSGKYQPQSTSRSTTITSASGKSQMTGKSGKGHFDDGASGTQGSSGVSSGSGNAYGNASNPGAGASAGRGSNGGGQGVGRGR